MSDEASSSAAPQAPASAGGATAPSRPPPRLEVLFVSCDDARDPLTPDLVQEFIHAEIGNDFRRICYATNLVDGVPCITRRADSSDSDEPTYISAVIVTHPPQTAWGRIQLRAAHVFYQTILSIFSPRSLCPCAVPCWAAESGDVAMARGAGADLAPLTKRGAYEFIAERARAALVRAWPAPRAAVAAWLSALERDEATWAPEGGELRAGDDLHSIAVFSALFWTTARESPLAVGLADKYAKLIEYMLDSNRIRVEANVATLRAAQYDPDRAPLDCCGLTGCVARHIAAPTAPAAAPAPPAASAPPAAAPAPSAPQVD